MDVEPKKTVPTVVKPVAVNGDRTRYEELKDWLRTNEERLADAVLADDERLSHNALSVYPAVKGGCLAYGTGCFGDTDPYATVYVLGDTHGDFDSCLAVFFTILRIAKENGETAPVVYLLGDVVDRNGEGCMLECALILAILQKTLPDEFAELNSIRLGVVKGDHDIGLLYAEPYAPETRFRAMVSPADYCDWLNKRIDDGGGESVTKIGRAWIRLMKECPAAVFLEQSGTLLSHGGVPREDLQKRIAAGEPYMFQSEAFAQDFEWCRMVDVKKKLLNRGSKTSEIAMSSTLSVGSPFQVNSRKAWRQLKFADSFSGTNIRLKGLSSTQSGMTDMRLFALPPSVPTMYWEVRHSHTWYE